MLGFVVGLDLHGLAVSAGHAVALAFGSLDDEIDTAIVSKSLVRLESECGATANDCGGGRTLYPGECRRRGHDGTTELHDPEVEPLEKVQSGNLALCAEHRFGILRKGSLVLREDLLVGERLPAGGDHLHDTFILGLVGCSDAAPITAVPDELAALDFCSSHALGAALHLLEGDAGIYFIIV